MLVEEKFEDNNGVIRRVNRRTADNKQDQKDKQ